MGGFEVLHNLESPFPSVVIVTAYDQYAIQAFEEGAVDYLLKPVSKERLGRCLERVQQLQSSSALAAASIAKLRTIAEQTPATRLNKIVGRLGEEYHLLDSRQVLAFQAERELVWIITRKQRYLATQPLKAVQAKLAGMNFARIHRNALVNLDHVVKMAPLSSQRWLLTLSNQQEFVVSKRQAQEVRKLLHW
jgi:DNA-binding LytR/AlgR family response regulator